MSASSPGRLEHAAARNLVTKYLRLKPGENVIVETWPHSLPMASAMVDEARRVGARALVHLEDEESYFSALERKQSKLLGLASEPEWAALQKADAYVMFWGPEDVARRDKFPDPVVEESLAWNQKWYEMARKSGLRGLRMEYGRATPSKAREYGVSLGTWKKELLEAALADPEEMLRSGERLQKRFAKGRKIRITHRNGTDLEVGVDHPKSRVYAGVPTRESKANPFGMMHNAPVGSFASTLDGTTAEGTIVANRPSYSDWGITQGGKFVFEGGHLVAHRFAKGGAKFDQLYATAKPGKDRTGFVYIGLNPAIHQIPNMEDCERGAICVSVGRNSFLGGENSSDFMGWVTLAGAEISVDGSPVVRSGKIL